jgi:hypothetical protein
MYGLDGRYVVMTAFLVGCDHMSGGALLEGFERWLLDRHLPGTSTSSLSWEGLVVHIRQPGLRSYRDLDEEGSRPLVDFLADELDSFLKEREVAALSA